MKSNLVMCHYNNTETKPNDMINYFDVMRNGGLDEAQARIKIAGRNINNFRYADDIILVAESKEELNSLLKKVKEESEKVGLKFSIQKTKIQSPHFMANRWGNNDSILGAPKSLQMVTAAMKLKDACSLEEKAMINLDSILKSRDITLPTKVCLVKAMDFPVVMYGCESWTIKKAER